MRFVHICMCVYLWDLTEGVFEVALVEILMCKCIKVERRSGDK